MELHQVFINPAGRLRSGWRVLTFVLAYIASLFLVNTAARVVYALAINIPNGVVPGPYVTDVIFRLTLLSSALLAGYFCLRLLEDLPWRALGLSFHPGWFRDFLIGSLIGVAAVALATGMAKAGGGLQFTASDRGILIQVGQTLFFSAGVFIVAALAEEALFRGYPLQTLTRAQLAWLGVALTSVPFAAIHLKNPNVVQGFTFINTALAGVWLAIAYLRTRSLWFPLGLHWAWNWALGFLFGLPVSGITAITPHPLLRGVDLGPSWLTGGGYGIEGGVAGTVTLICVTIFTWRTRLVSASEEMKLLTSHENPVREKGVVSILPQSDGNAST